jgi:hypothetical protein
MAPSRRGGRGRLRGPGVGPRAARGGVTFHSLIIEVVMRLFFVFLLIGVLSATAARAQDSPFQMFFKEFSGLAVWTSAGFQNKDHVPTRLSFGQSDAPIRYGFELLLGPYPEMRADEVMNKLDDAIDTCRKALFLAAPQGREYEAMKGRLDRLERVRDSLVAVQEIEDNNRWKVELGLGFEYSDSYRPGNDSLSFGFPVSGYYVSTYAYPPFLQAPRGSCGLYFGGSCGMYDLSRCTAYRRDNGEAFEMTASTISIDLVPIGAFIETGNIAGFVELTYKYLAFDGIRYEPVNDGAVPLNAPPRFDLSGFHVSIGIQYARK